LQDYARRIFALRDGAEQAMADLDSLRLGHLSVGAGPTVGVYLLPRVLVGFRRRYPQIRLNLETEGPDVLRQRLIDGMLDLAITEAAPPAATELLSTVVAHDVLVPIAAKNHPAAASKRPMSAAAFARYPFIAREVGSGAKSLVERTLAARGLAVQPVLTVASTEAIKQAVIAGLGVAMVSRLSIRTEIEARQIVELPVKGMAIRYPIYHVRRRGRSKSQAVTAFLQMLDEVRRDASVT
jgi:DNA-binding transcriptional LysR family regulator